MSLPDQNQLFDALSLEFKRSIPSGTQIAERAIRSAFSADFVDQAYVRANLSKLVESIQKDAYASYQQAEKKAWQQAFDHAFAESISSCESVEVVHEFIISSFETLDRFFLMLTQSRRNRAGRAFEMLLEQAFEILQIPCKAQPKLDGNPDFVFPSVNQYKLNPMETIVLTVKRTLRERWRQVATEGAKGNFFFLATIDEKVKDVDLKAIQNSKIYLVVPKRIKSLCYSSYPHVITFETFLDDYLFLYKSRWDKRPL